MHLPYHYLYIYALAVLLSQHVHRLVTCILQLLKTSLRWIAIDKKWEYHGNRIKMDDLGIPGF